MLKEAYHKAIELYSGASLDTDELRDELKAALATLGVAHKKPPRRETRRQPLR